MAIVRDAPSEWDRCPSFVHIRAATSAVMSHKNDGEALWNEYSRVVSALNAGVLCGGGGGGCRRYLCRKDDEA